MEGAKGALQAYLSQDIVLDSPSEEPVFRPRFPGITRAFPFSPVKRSPRCALFFFEKSNFVAGAFICSEGRGAHIQLSSALCMEKNQILHLESGRSGNGDRGSFGDRGVFLLFKAFNKAMNSSIRVLRDGRSADGRSPPDFARSQGLHKDR